jgi:hypothetical protein
MLAFLIGGLSPGIAGATETRTEFVGGIAEANLVFGDGLNNTSLALDLPRGTQVTSAEVTLEGVMGTLGNFTRFDFATHNPGANIWALFEDNLDDPPPDFDPYNSGYDVPSATDIDAVEKSDDVYWELHTAGESLPPPTRWPLQHYHFRPQATEAVALTTHWEGYSRCKANNTNEYHAEMWLYNHTFTKWDLVAEYGTNNAGDVNLTFTFDPDADYVSTNGSIEMAIVGLHAQGFINPPVVINDYGHLYTDYAGIQVENPSLLSWPEDVNMSVAGRRVLEVDGTFHGPTVIGDPGGLKDAIQAAVDDHRVEPGNLTIPFEFTVGSNNGAQLRVRDLRVEFEPPVNQAPTWEGPSSVQVWEDSSWTTVIYLDTAFIDDYNQAELFLEVEDVSDPANLSARIRLGTVNGDVIEVLPAPDFFGQVGFTLRATDLFNATTVSPVIDVMVNQTPDDPSILHLEEQTVEEGSTLDITIDVEDPDLPDDEFTFSDSSPWIDIDPTSGHITWTPNETQVGRHQTVITVTDRFGRNDSLLLTIIVTNRNNAPVITSGLTIQAVQDGPTSYTISAYDPDVASGDELSFYAIGEGIDVLCEPATGVCTFTPTNDHVPMVEITIGVLDQIGERHEAVLIVAVENVNDPPSFQGPTTYIATQGEQVDHQLVFDDPDLHIVTNGPGSEEALTLTYDGPDVFSPGEDGQVTFEALQSLVGSHTVTYTVTDRDGLTDIVEFTWEVLNVNDAPQIVTQVGETHQAIEDEITTLQLQADDIDGDVLVWSDDTDIFDIGPDDGLIEFTPLQDHVGTHRVVITVTDGNGGSDSVMFDLVVSNTNDAPVIASVLPEDGSKHDKGTTVRFEATANDEDGDELTFTWTLKGKELGQGAIVDHKDLPTGTNKVLLVVSDGTDSAQHELTVVIRDGDGGGSSSIVMIVILVAMIASVTALVLFMRTRTR